WFGGKYYVDLLAPGVTEKFIEITLDAYRRELGEHFGKRLPGVFTDEPHLTPAGGIHWSQRLPNDFKERWGYDLMDHLPSLVRPLGDYKKVRHNFFQLLLELFIERWAKPCYEFCDKHNLEFTGHYWEHGWPGAGHGGDNMAMYAWHHRPAIDTLMNQYREDTHAQFGNARAVRELSSVANQLDRTRTLCEAYGAGGWDLRFEDMKRIGDWLYVLGVNTLNEHLSYITIRGARKRDHPQSFSYHTPWWKAYHVMAGYFTRLSLVLSQGEQINQVLLIEPTTTAWMYQPDSSQRARLGDIGNQFQDMVLSLERAQVEYDIGCEDIMAREGSVEEGLLKVGKRRYETVVLPPLTENLNAKVMDLLEAYLKAGGVVICCGPPPARVDGRLSERGQKASRHSGWSRLEPAAVPKKLLSRPAGLTILRDEDDKGILFHHRRQMDDGEFLFLVNTSITAPSSGTIKSTSQGLEQWDLQTGKISKYAFKKTGNGIKTEFQLPPCGSLLLLLTKKSRNPAPTKAEITTEIPAKGPPTARRLEHNVLTLDYVDVTADGKTRKNIYFYRANQFAFQQNGMGRNPWDSAVQFRDELIKKKFPADSGFEATYRFTIEKQVPNELYIVIERPDLYSIKCNGKAVKAIKDSWWLDKSFGKINIRTAAKVGENAVTIKASPFTIYHELEPAYVLGDFALKAVDSGFVIIPEGKLNLNVEWNQQGYPFYAAGFSYTQKFEVPQPKGRYQVQLPHWYGSVAEVIVNGKPAGYIGYQPWQCDVTPLVKPGKNKIEIVVIGTLKNTLGPHHAGQTLGAAWPNMFHRGPETGPPPGNQYYTVGYGLFKPFVLKNTIKRAQR
ncbi:MAG: glycosyl hydrolase, partial [Planctomycetota bacterium]